MASVDERRAGFKRYKEDVERRGKPFFPFAMFHDTVMSLVVVCVIIALGVHLEVTADRRERYTGWLGAVYTDKADPGTTNFVPRPDWYFYFLFYLLRIFKWPETVILGTIGIPTICLILLIALPFVDLRKERRISRRPVALVAAILVVLSMGVLTYKGAVAKESLASEVVQAVPSWAAETGLREQREGRRRREALRPVGLYFVPHVPRHRLLEPRRTRSERDRRERPDRVVLLVVRQQPAQVQQPVMPVFGNLGSPENIRDIGVFLDASKGGSSGRAGAGLPRHNGRFRAHTRCAAEALLPADCEVGLCASGAGIEVIGTEVYDDARLPRDEVLARLTDGAGDAVTMYDPSDWSSPYASGSAKVDGTSSARARCRRSRRSRRERCRTSFTVRLPWR